MDSIWSYLKIQCHLKDSILRSLVFADESIIMVTKSQVSYYSKKIKNSAIRCTKYGLYVRRPPLVFYSSRKMLDKDLQPSWLKNGANTAYLSEVQLRPNIGGSLVFIWSILCSISNFQYVDLTLRISKLRLKMTLMMAL